MSTTQRLTLLDPILQAEFSGEQGFENIMALQGEVYRAVPGRRTIRFTRKGESYFAKLHSGVGWREIFKNLFQLKLPIVSAANEWLAIQRFNELGIATMTLAGYGSKGWIPAQRKSFILTKDLGETISLEDFCHDWPTHPPDISLKRALLEKVADIAKRLHEHGVNHRDFYLCHFLLDTSRALSPEQLHIYVIDLHRVQMRPRVPARWLLKDLAGLYFSAMDIGLTKRDYLRFVKAYHGQSLRKIFQDKHQLWKKIEKKALRLHQKPLSLLDQNPRRLHSNDIYRLSVTRAIGTPFSVSLPDSTGQCSELTCENIVRHLPGKRLTCLATLDGQAVFAKLFIDPGNAKRHWQREDRGIRALLDKRISTPPLLYSGPIVNSGHHILISQHITPALTLDAAWKTADAAERTRLVRYMVGVFAAHHRAGLMHRDAHFGNFLVAGEDILTLDGDQISVFPAPLDKKQSFRSLGLFFGQLPLDHDGMIDEAFSEYLALRGWHKNAAAMSSLHREAQATREYRKKKFLKKIFRHSGPFICHKNWQQLSAYDRSYDSEKFRSLLNSLDELLDSKACAIIKRGNTATVGIIELDDGRALVIKRYNIKSFWHAISRALRRTRAAVSWRNAHLLNFYEINTPTPIALIEKRFGPLRRTSYFISSYLEGIDCGSYFGGNAALTSEQKEMAGRISALISNLAEVNISHGDMKASNIIISSKQPMLLDLDALRQHRLKIIHKRAFARDMQRFLRNWEMLSPAYNLFESSLLKPLKKPGTRS